MALDLRNVPLGLQHVLFDAERRGIDLYGADLYAFPQTWGNTSCGHGGMAGQAITTAMTYAIVHDGVCDVWTGGRWLRQMTDRLEFMDCIHRCRFPGKGER